MTTIATAKKRANSSISCKISGTELIFSLWGTAKGQDAPVVTEEFRFDCAKVHEANRERAVVHGFKQRLADGAAKGKFDEKTGRLITAAEKFAGIKRLAEHYLSGTDQWELRVAAVRAVDSQAENRQVLKAALGMVRTDRTAEQIHQFVEELKPAQIAGLMVHKDLVEAVALVREQLSREKGAEVDAEELLASF